MEKSVEFFRVPGCLGEGGGDVLLKKLEENNEVLWIWRTRKESAKAIMRKANRKEDKAKGEKRGERGWEMEERVESMDQDKVFKRKMVTATAGRR